jgi:hypothetical protein
MKNRSGLWGKPSRVRAESAQPMPPEASRGGGAGRPGAGTTSTATVVTLGQRPITGHPAHTRAAFVCRARSRSRHRWPLPITGSNMRCFPAQLAPVNCGRSVRIAASNLIEASRFMVPSVHPPVQRSWRSWSTGCRRTAPPPFESCPVLPDLRKRRLPRCAVSTTRRSPTSMHRCRAACLLPSRQPVISPTRICWPVVRLWGIPWPWSLRRQPLARL